jgi:hypothetical protein
MCECFCSALNSKNTNVSNFQMEKLMQSTKRLYHNSFEEVEDLDLCVTLQLSSSKFVLPPRSIAVLMQTCGLA